MGLTRLARSQKWIWQTSGACRALKFNAWESSYHEVEGASGGSDELLVRAEQYQLPYTASTDLSVVMLNNFLNFLDQTDVTQVTWAQYMDITCCNGVGLLDYYGNARPSWHSFKFWGDVPTERVVTPPLPALKTTSHPLPSTSPAP